MGRQEYNFRANLILSDLFITYYFKSWNAENRQVHGEKKFFFALYKQCEQYKGIELFLYRLSVDAHRTNAVVAKPEKPPLPEGQTGASDNLSLQSPAIGFFSCFRIGCLISSK
ncbi:hypothetical protein [Desulfocastanea catecholica]